MATPARQTASPLLLTCVQPVRLPPGSPVVRRKRRRLGGLVEAVGGDVGENGAPAPPLRRSAQGGLEAPVPQVPRLEQPLHQPQEAAVVDALAEDRQQD